jgi:hypothetical protein
MVGSVIVGAAGGFYAAAKPVFDDYVVSYLQERKAEGIVAAFQTLDPDLRRLHCEVARIRGEMVFGLPFESAYKIAGPTFDDLRTILPKIERRIVASKPVLQGDPNAAYARARDFIEGIDVELIRRMVPDNEQEPVMPGAKTFIAIMDRFFASAEPILTHPIDLEKDCRTKN